MIRTLIIDDEPHAISYIESLVKQQCTGIEIVGNAKSVDEAVEKIDTLKPQLLLLDVIMPFKDGFKLLEYFPNPTFKVIFITAAHEKAVNAFEAQALSFVTKPIDHLKFERAIGLAKDAISKDEQIGELKYIIETLTGINRTLRIPHSGEEDSIILIDDLMYLKADGAWTHFYKHNDKKVICASKNMGRYEGFLKENDAFFRIHNSYLVNKKFITAFKHKGDGGLLTLKDNTELEVSRNRKKDFLTWLSHQKIDLAPTIN